jgi:putative FmdB family regulatory protein
MPLYEFRCTECENEFEDLLLVDEINPKCPECNSNTEKMISRSLAIVKGSSNRLLDCVIGEDADKKWAAYRKRKEKRTKEAKQKEVQGGK